MAKTKISELPEFTGDTTGVFLVMDSSDLNTTYRVSKENLVNINGSNNKLSYFTGSNHITSSQRFNVVNGGETLSLGTTAYSVGSPERFMVDGGNSYNIATFQTSTSNHYAQLNVKNFDDGTNSSADLVLWNDVSTENSGYVDLGINSSNYSANEIGYGGDGYLYSATNDLYVGSTQTDNHGHLHLFAGNMWSTSSISIYNDGTIGFGTDWLDNDAYTIPSSNNGFVYEFSGSVKLNNSLSVEGDVTGSIIHSTNNGEGKNFKVGDDAWIGDVNRTNSIQISGQQDSTKGYILFGSGSSSPSFGYGGSNDHVDLSCALKLQQFATLPTATVGTLAVSGSHLYFHNGTGWNQVV